VTLTVANAVRLGDLQTIVVVRGRSGVLFDACFFDSHGQRRATIFLRPLVQPERGIYGYPTSACECFR
jgi:hypothetical protein